MKKQHFTLSSIIVFVFIFQISFGQISDNSFDPAAESVRLAPTPTSPEAQAFTKYGNMPVNMYTGTPNIQIPIYTHKGRELDLPISLTYDASGIKVEQLATNVGLGWNLNVGGRVTRITNGMPDDFSLTSHTYGPYKSFWDTEVKNGITAYDDLSTNPTFGSYQNVVDYLYFLKKANDNEYDIQPDYFSFNALGNKDMIVIDVSTKIPKTLNNPRIEVSLTKPVAGANTPITKWTVTMDDGTIYTFEETEVSQDTNLNDTGPNTFYGFKKEFNSSWLLTKIESANGKDIYEFTYTDLGFWTSNSNASSITGVTNVIEIDNNIPPVIPTDTNLMGYNSSEYKIRQKVLREITHNGKRIVDIDLLTDRWDMTVDSAIEKIYIYDDDTDNNTADLHKSYNFNFSYFRTANAKLPPYNSGNIPLTSNVRLKLDSINIKDRNSVIVKDYSFEYIYPYSIASTTSKSQDYYGYYNGVSNTVLYPTSSAPTITGYNGANRDPSFSSSKKGLLNKITYPTGGHTEFEYEPNYEREVTGTSTVWQTISSTELDYPMMPPVDPNACNAISQSTSLDVTPATDHDTFQISQNQTDIKVYYDQYGVKDVFYQMERTGTIIKISSPTATLSWTDVFDNNCGIKTGVDVVWSMPPKNTAVHYLETITLDAGYYQILLSNPSSNLSNSLYVKESSLITTYDFNEKAGVRVKDIKDYTDATSLAIHKSYEYPSGTVISQPIYEYYSTQYSVDVTPKVSTILHRLSYASGTDKPHIGYEEVIETINDVNGSESIGKTSNTFNTSHYGTYHTGVYTYYINGKESAKQYSVDYELGKSNGSTIYDKNDVLVSSTDNTYYDQDYYSNKGLFILTDENKSNRYPIPAYNSSTGEYYVNFVGPASYYIGPGGTVGMVPPSDCTNLAIWGSSTAYSELCNPGIARLTKYPATAWARAGNITQSSSRQYYNAATNIVEQITDYTYYDEDLVTYPFPNKPPVIVPGNYLLKDKETTDSKGVSLKQEFLYPDHVSIGDGSLESVNMLAIPLETKVYKNDILMSYKKTHYSGTLPSKIQTSKGSQTLEDRLLYERFEDGNLVQVKQVNGPTTVYIWGYDKRYVIAKVENATYTDIEALSAFGGGSGFTIDTILTTTQENALRAMSNVLVTTYDYDPIVGVTSIKDPRGNIITYHYDDFHRLKYIKDKDGKILSKNDYNYGPQN
ncbi:MAG: hypothetical protein ABFS12_13460 [Bacteroidota bacterium]